MQAYIRSGLDQGARLITGGERLPGDGYFLAPTLFADVLPSMRIAQDVATAHALTRKLKSNQVWVNAHHVGGPDPPIADDRRAPQKAA